MDQAPLSGPSSSPRREGAGPPPTRGGGGSSLWPQKRWERPDRAVGYTDPVDGPQVAPRRKGPGRRPWYLQDLGAGVEQEVSCHSLHFGLEPSDSKRTRRSAAPSADAAPEAAAVRASDNGGGKAACAGAFDNCGGRLRRGCAAGAAAAGAAAAPAPAPAAEAAVDATRRLFPRVFSHGEWPPAKIFESTSELDAQYPNSYCHLPKKMSQLILDAITLQEAAGSDEKITTIIEEEGVVNLPARVLEAVAGDLFLEARAEAQALFDAQFAPGGEKWDALFHDKEGPKGAIRVGDQKKTMSKRLPLDSKIVQFLQRTVSKLSPGFRLARDPDGLLHVTLLHHSQEDLFSREHYAQEVHGDLHCHGGGDHFSERTLPACLRLDGPRVMWASFAKDPIALFFYLRSHHVSRLANQFFVHYGILWAEYHRTHPGSKEEDFKPIWAVFVEQHIQAGLKSLGIQVEPEAVLHSVEPYGGALWHALTGHGGTSQQGLRVFAMLLKEEDQDVVELPQSSIELWRASRIYAGVMDVTLRPLEVALASKIVLDKMSNFFAHPSDAGTTRSATSCVNQALLQVLDTVRSETGVRPMPGRDDKPPAVRLVRLEDGVMLMPGHANKPVVLRFKHSSTFLGLVCSVVGRRRVVLWFESKASNPTKGALFRGAAFTQELIQSQDRRVQESLRALCLFMNPRRPVATVEFTTGGFSLLYSTVLMDGEPLNHRLQRDFKQWRDYRELNESGRYALSGLVQAVDRVEDYGFRLVMFDPAIFCIDADDHVKLMFSGGGFLGQKTQPQCNRRPHQGPQPLIRRNTSAEQDARARMNMRRIGVIQSQRPSQLEAEQPEDQDNEVDPGQAAAAFKEWSDADLRNWSTSQHGKTMGVLGRWNAEFQDLVADDDLIQDLKAAEGADQIMERLRLTDVHQIMTWLVCELRDASRAGEKWTERRPMLDHVLQKCDSMEDIIQGMQHFVLGRNPMRPKPARTADSEPSLPCNQPAAFKRLLEMVIFSLHAAYRERAAKELSYMLFVTTAVFSSGDELLLSGEGISMEVQLYPFDDPVFIGEVNKMFQKVGAKGLDKFPRTVLLKNEEEYGVGVYGPDVYEKGDFLGFYLGTVEDEPHGRHVVTSIGSKKAKYCNGGNRRFLPVSAHLKRGTPGSYMNSSRNRLDKDGSCLKPNARADREHQVLHTHEGRRMTCIPLFALYYFEKAFIIWDYDPEAGHGVSFRS
jgi:hypothetical protein